MGCIEKWKLRFLKKKKFWKCLVHIWKIYALINFITYLPVSTYSITNSICGSHSSTRTSIIWTISWLTPTKEEREHLSQGKNHGGTASKNNAWLLHIWTFKKLKNVHYWQFLKNNTSHTHTQKRSCCHTVLLKRIKKCNEIVK